MMENDKYIILIKSPSIIIHIFAIFLSFIFVIVPVSLAMLALSAVLAAILFVGTTFRRLNSIINGKQLEK